MIPNDLDQPAPGNAILPDGCEVTLAEAWRVLRARFDRVNPIEIAEMIERLRAVHLEEPK